MSECLSHLSPNGTDLIQIPGVEAAFGSETCKVEMPEKSLLPKEEGLEL